MPLMIVVLVLRATVVTMARIDQATSSDGTRIAYRVHGPGTEAAAPPILLVHGWAQSGACWGPEALGKLAEHHRVIAMDLRGHGCSDEPGTGYSEPQAWADDVEAVLAREEATGAILVGWSYGGLVLCDYLAERGTRRVAGVVLVAAITSLGRGRPGAATGPAMKRVIPGALSEDPGVAAQAFLDFGPALIPPGCDARGAVEQALVGASLCTPPSVRGALFRRDVDHDATLRGLGVPVLFLHGTADEVVDIGAARHGCDLVPRASHSWWEGAGHAPFLEAPDRFVEEIEAFAGSC
ncbi:alpha/beta fold hydrolase [Lolliginicoccus levis]|uniref:alpha/beta fold hydrolase n=1 Tax=Lolliginicoccus levis TaxID=2919542 RepID=UPI00241DAD91|nr:alpha/beta hydrolase [Lolliginicoccus levis]